MAENLSPCVRTIIKYLPFCILRTAKIGYRNPRYHFALKKSRKAYHTYGNLYTHNVLFVAGLPKSGTTWLENMLAGFSGYTIVPDPHITIHDYKFGGTHHYDISPEYLDSLNRSLALVKIHAHGSSHNIKLLNERHIPYCIMYRDLRDAAVSYVCYVQRTPWHPEYPIYKNLDLKAGLYHFGKTLLPEWRDWVVNWLENRDPERSIVLKYEDLLKDNEKEFLRLVNFYNLPQDKIIDIVEANKFSKVKSKSSFFRKGGSGDWKNHFDDRISDLFKSQIGDFLIDQKYESDRKW